MKSFGIFSIFIDFCLFPSDSKLFPFYKHFKLFSLKLGTIAYFSENNFFFNQLREFYVDFFLFFIFILLKGHSSLGAWKKGYFYDIF